MTAILIEASIKSSLILCVALIAAMLLRRQSAAMRHTVWTVGLLCSLALPLFGLVLPAWHVAPIRTVQHPEHDIAPPVVAAQSGPAAVLAPVVAVPATPGRFMLEQAGLLVWLLGVLAVASLLFREAVRLARVAFGSSTVRQTSWRTLTREVSNALRLTRRVRLMRNPNASVLGTWGTLRPRVLIPRESKTWSNERMRVVLGHELAHVKRNDWLVQVIAETARAIYWFNPLFWIACTQLRRESEHACDDTAMRLGSSLGIDGPTYAGHVLDLARTLKHSGQPGTAALAMASPSNLERRLVAMLNPSLNRRATGIRTSVIVVLLALGLTLPLAAMQSQAATEFSATIRANTTVIDAKGVQFRGNVRLTADSVTLTADELKYDPAKQSLEARGNVMAKSSQSKVEASSATLLIASTAPKSPAAEPIETAPPAQTATGTLSGTIIDQTGAVIRGARITMTAQSTGTILRTLSNETGNYAFTQLPPDTYSGTVKVVDFKDSQFTYVLSVPGSSARLNVAMALGLTTIIDVAAQGPPGLRCFSVFGAFKADGTPFTEADCPRGTVFVAPPRPQQAVPQPATPEVISVNSPPPTIPAAGQRPIRVGGDVQAGNLLYHPNPAYPTEARNRGIEGSVILTAVITEDGQVRSLKIINSSNPLLESGVLEMIQNWRYKPTRLNGEPVEVMTTITVNFTLDR